MSAGGPTTHRNSLGTSLGLGEKLFATPAERRFVAAVDSGLELVEEGLLREIAFADEIADATTRYLLAAGGKRVRPTLTLLIAQLGDGATPGIVASAQATEITHLASLYHDDVMDEAQMRRGVPSAQAVWGNNVAILSGDLLFARASTIVSGLGQEAILLQAETFERLCLGQLHETIGPREGDDPIAHYIDVLADKTGSLISTAARAGVMFSGAPREYLAPVAEFGEKIGIAFQLIDDVIDLSDQPAETGKKAGTDLRAGVVTLPVLYLRELARTDLEASALLSEIDRIVEATHGDVDGAEIDESARNAAETTLDDEFADVVRRLREHDVTERTRLEAHRWAREALDALAPLPSGPVKKALTRFADRVVERSA
ncbi:polyprenyl synthetase family protein [Frigoribacterium sp. CFBP9039]|uniref:polyprenyl synthetase family protein n=1 Tax=unclassified Frigoribacterium TaxID=2627005 RepID=UPI001785DDD6|nr:polyprenyl synthetase family protein [Frigoribacterium sp. CFBP9039]MBD8702635.1 polyprenyl synthetase family protein [Frigoribacterium sp. CFBP 13712]MDY0946126.1 polyprenyl synthetase family protein [Frigoribacterium sp. CFBP9039]